MRSFPVSTRGLLHYLDCHGPVLLLAGQVVSLHRHELDPNGQWAEIDDRRLGAAPVGDLSDSLITLLEEARPRVLSWVAERQSSADPLHLQGGLRRMSAADRAAVADFVARQLVPRLEAEAAGAVPLVGTAEERARSVADRAAGSISGAAGGTPALAVGAGPADHPGLSSAMPTGEDSPEPEPDDDLVTAPAPDWSRRLVTSALQHWPRWRAFVGLSCHDLAPYWGPPRPGQLYLRYGKGSYCSLGCRSVEVACADQDHALEAAALDVLGQAPCPGLELQPLYQDTAYAVLVSASGVHYCCRQVPAYVLEDERGTLYRFPPVQVGICLDTLRPAQVLRPGAAVVMHRYEHPFLFAGVTGAPLCMPRPAEYYRGLARMPLAEALLQHLESARLTLCSGFFKDSPFHGYYHPSMLACHQITRMAAEGAGLPVYPYDRQATAR